jgi:hypothetical protein
VKTEAATWMAVGAGVLALAALGPGSRRVWAQETPATPPAETAVPAQTATPPAATPAREAAPPSDAPAGRQALVGRWKLNQDLSEDPREKMREAMSGRWGGGGGYGRGGGMGGGMGHGGWGHHGGGWGRGGGEGEGGGGSRGQGGQPPMMALLNASELTVTNVEPEVGLVEPDGVVETLYPDGKKHKNNDSGVETQTSWKDATLKVERKTERGKLGETWSVSPDGKRLTLLLEIQRGSMPTVSVRRVYDREEQKAS